MQKQILHLCRRQLHRLQQIWRKKNVSDLTPRHQQDLSQAHLDRYWRDQILKVQLLLLLHLEQKMTDVEQQNETYEHPEKYLLVPEQ